MTTATSQRQPELTRQTVVVIGGGADIVPETARRTRAEGAGMVMTGHNPRRLERAAADVPEQVDHVMVTAAGPAFR
jgi:NADP-dependent 3-hydroxy acid dehydrogenase YdfG